MTRLRKLDPHRHWTPELSQFVRALQSQGYRIEEHDWLFFDDDGDLAEIVIKIEDARGERSMVKFHPDHML